MKHLKMIGVALIAVAAVMAIAGAAGAQASTALCKIKTPTCTGSNLYPANTVLSGKTAGTVASGSPALLTTATLGTVKCTSTVTGESTEVTNSPLKGKITGLTWSECSLSGEPCTVTSVHLPYASTFERTAENKVKAVASSGGTGNPGATVKCGGVIECEYTTASAELTGEGGAVGTGFLEATKVPLTRSNETGKCPKSTWDAKYLLESPAGGVFISE